VLSVGPNDTYEYNLAAFDEPFLALMKRSAARLHKPAPRLSSAGTPGLTAGEGNWRTGPGGARRRKPKDGLR